MAKINVSSVDSMSDQPVDISVVGLKPCQLVTLHSHNTIHSKSFECVALYVADIQGCINLATDSAIGGQFIGKEPMGMFWAMKPSLNNKRPLDRFMKLDVTTPLVVTIKAYDASIKSLEELHDMRKKRNLYQLELASVKVNRWFMAPGTKRITLTMEKDGIHGTLFIPPGDGPFPGVVVLSGNHPGTIEYKASLLASHGFAVLSIAFYGVPGLPLEVINTNVPLALEYFEKTVEFLSNHSQVHSTNGVGLIGISLCSALSLAIAECIPNIKCVVWISGFIYMFYCNASYIGKVYALEYCDVREIPANNPNACQFSMRYLYPKYNNECQPNPEARIKFYDRHNINYMFIAGLDDNNIPSEYHINKAERLLKEARHPNFQILRYPGAGHLIEPPYGIHNGVTMLKNEKIITWGGEMIPHCKAQEDSWTKQINFLRSSLTDNRAYAKL